MTVSRTVGKMTFYNLWRRYRGLDKNGGCNFPDYPEKGWRFVKKEFCDDDVAKAWKQGCCLTPALNKLDYNDFQTGNEDSYEQAREIWNCRGFELGNLSEINLSGFLTAWHTGK